MKHNRRISPPSHQRVKDLFDYAAEGRLIRRTQEGKEVPGSIAGSLKSHGYTTLNIDKRRYQLHRIIFLWHHGFYPEFEVDHINGDQRDNRIENLQECTHMCNLQKVPKRSTNTSGIIGVSPTKKGRWQVHICYAGEKKYLGEFTDKVSAARVRYEEEKRIKWAGLRSPGGAREFLLNQGESV